jgi:hypothetical protein
MATSLHNRTQATTWQSGKVSLVNSRKFEKINKFFSTSATLALVQLGCKAGAEPFPRSSQRVKAENTVPRRSDGFTFISIARMFGPTKKSNDPTQYFEHL